MAGYSPHTHPRYRDISPILMIMILIQNQNRILGMRVRTRTSSPYAMISAIAFRRKRRAYRGTETRAALMKDSAKVNSALDAYLESSGVSPPD